MGTKDIILIPRCFANGNRNGNNICGITRGLDHGVTVPLAPQTLFTLHAPTENCGLHTIRDLRASGYHSCYSFTPEVKLPIQTISKVFFKKETTCIHNQGKKEDVLFSYSRGHLEPCIILLSSSSVN